MTTPDYPSFDLGIPGITDGVKVGAGGFGVVYRAVEADLGRPVAIKLLSGNLNEADQLRFDRERRAMGTLSGHPNIVTVYRSGYASSGNAYLVMEFLANGSLADRLQSHGPLPWTDVLKFGIQLSGALETSHRAGVLHRDIKPANILLSRLGNAKLCDFGIARLHGAPETRSTVITASIAHAPPEIMNGQRPDEVADVYSLASTMFELMAGTPPFVRPTDESMIPILARIQQDPVPSLPPDQLPAPLAEALQRAMSKDPVERPNSALAFGELLMSVEDQLGRPPTPLPIEIAAAYEAGDTPPAEIPPFPTSSSGPLPAPGTPDGAPMSSSGPLPAPGTPNGEPAAPPHASTGGPAGMAPPVDATVVAEPTGDLRPVGADAVVPAPPQPVSATGAGAASPAESTESAPKQGVRLVLIVAAVAVAIAGLGALGWVAVRDQSVDTATGEGQPGDTATGQDQPGDTATTATVNPDATESSALVSDGTGSVQEPVPGDGDEDYAFYVPLRDASGTISILVPDEWTDVERGPGGNGLPFLAAAPTLEGAFYDSFLGPGVSVSVQDRAIFDFNAALDTMALDECIVAGRRDLDEPYRGMTEFLSDCGGTETQIVQVVFVDSADNRTVEIRVQVLDQRDVLAATTVVNSLVLE